MKRFLFPIVFLIASCSDEKKFDSVTKNEDGTTTKQTISVDTDKMSDVGNEMTKKMEELKKLKPMSIEELKASLPEEINGIKRSDFTANSMGGYAFAEGDYKKDDSSNIKMVIYDCAGEAGSAMYGMNYWTKMSFQQESSTGYTKTIDFKGGKAVETFDSRANQSSLTYLANERMLVTITGNNIKPDELKDGAKDLRL